MCENQSQILGIISVNQNKNFGPIFSLNLLSLKKNHIEESENYIFRNLLHFYSNFHKKLERYS